MTVPTRREIASLFRSTKLLGSIADEDLLDLAAQARHLEFRVGDLVFSRQSEAESVFFVIEGRLKISVTGKNGNEMLLSVIDPGEFCGLIWIMEQGTRDLDGRAERRTRLLSIECRVMYELLLRNAEAAMALVGIAQLYLREAIANVEMLGLDNAEARLWRRLMELGQRYGRTHSASGALEIRHGLSQQDLADSVGLTRVMVNRQLGLWRDRGLISIERGLIWVADLKALEDHVRSRPE